MPYRHFSSSSKSPEETKVPRLEIKLLALTLEQQSEPFSRNWKRNNIASIRGDSLTFSYKSSTPNQPKVDVLKPPVASPSSEISALPSCTMNSKFFDKLGSRDYDKLTFLSLIHQIHLELPKGYSDKDVAEAVVKSVSPHSSIRNNVVTSPDHSPKNCTPFYACSFKRKQLQIFIKRW